MITNTDATLYHKTINPETLLEEWERVYIEKLWWFNKKGTSINKGYDESNDLNIRIPIGLINEELISIGDILVKGNISKDIKVQQDLKEYDIYNITEITINRVGLNPHIHLKGK